MSKQKRIDELESKIAVCEQEIQDWMAKNKDLYERWINECREGQNLREAITVLQQEESKLKAVNQERHANAVLDNAEIDMLKREISHRDRTIAHNIETRKKDDIQTAERRRAQLMSVYYLLTQIQTMGTHHEKEVACRYIRAVVEKMINDGDALPYKSYDDLPF